MVFNNGTPAWRWLRLACEAARRDLTSRCYSRAARPHPIWENRIKTRRELCDGISQLLKCSKSVQCFDTILSGLLQDLLDTCVMVSPAARIVNLSTRVSGSARLHPCTSIVPATVRLHITSKFRQRSNLVSDPRIALPCCAGFFLRIPLATIEYQVETLLRRCIETIANVLHQAGYGVVREGHYHVVQGTRAAGCAASADHRCLGVM